MQAHKEAPPDLQCKDKFLLQSVVANPGATILPWKFSKEARKVVEEFKLRVVYIPANPPSPVPEGSEEGNSPRASVLDNGNTNASVFDAVRSRSVDEPKEKASEAWDIISKLTEEKTSAIQQRQKLRQELVWLECLNTFESFSCIQIIILSY
ncbi:vesicle-associated protein 1-3-like [Tasmannia lanceolata]|uniref:vesicle-associated protein 1-3-like n=1 Tax=Tasmannia lanceolata TaxID=3420 RepID=UPI004064A007